MRLMTLSSSTTRETDAELVGAVATNTQITD